ncbi:MAG TPA: peptidylprolyl isomerase [Polyangiaceae bacterium]|nr:peptidylprolyl isomerase [Polyangiaceae bacterium]
MSALVPLFGCAGAAVSPNQASGPPAPSASTLAPALSSANDPAAIEPLARPGFRDEDCSVPVSARDPQWGKPTAPVTIVVFGNLQSPLDRQVQPALQRVQASYGPDAVRLVWKHFPAGAPPASLAAARAAVAVFSLSGSRAFWRFRELALTNQASLTSENFIEWATEVGTEPQVYAAAVELSGVTSKLEDDFELARQLDVRGTPEFFINGNALRQAVPFEVWQRHIEGQLAEARALLAKGTPAAELYSTLTNEHRPPPPAPDKANDQAFIEASHVLVQYAGAMRAPASISRSKTEAKARIDEVLAKARTGADFAQLAAEYSDEPSAATRRGALGRFRKGMMVKPFENAAFALQIGELSGVVETEFGFHVIKRIK